MNKKQEAAYDRLIRAAAKFVDAMGGKAVVAGGVNFQQWPGDSEFKFTVGVKITGWKPALGASAGEKEGKGESR